MRKTLLYLPAIVALGFSSANGDSFWNIFSGNKGVKGSGDRVTETRDLKGFSRIESSGSFDIYVTVGEELKVELTFDDNLLDLIETEVRGKTLEVYSEESFSSRYACRLDISVPSLESVRLSGSGDIEVVNLNNDSFEYRLSGSGDMRAEGKTNELELTVSGSGDIDTRDLIAEEAKVTVSGSGSIRVYVTESLDGRVSGSGDIYYYGKPEHVSTHVSGSGRVKGR